MDQYQYVSKIIKKIQQLNLHDKLETMSFDDFTKIIQKRFVIVLYKSFLKSLKLTNVKGRDILSAYVVAKWPEIVLPKEHDDCDKEYFEYSKEIISRIKNANIGKIRDFVPIYKKISDKWIEKDLKYRLDDLCSTYYTFECISNDVYLNDKKIKWKHSFHPDHIKPLQKSIKQNIKLIAGSKGLEYLKNFDYTLNIPVCKEQILDNLKKAFWNRFEKELREISPNYSMIPDLLKDIRNMIINLVKKNKRVVREIYEVLDISLYTQMIKNNAFNIEAIHKLSIYIIKKIKELGRPADDNDIEEWEKQIHRDLENYANIDFPKFLVEMFKKVMCYLDLIKETSDYLLGKTNSNIVKI